MFSWNCLDLNYLRMTYFYYYITALFVLIIICISSTKTNVIGHKFTLIEIMLAYIYTVFKFFVIFTE